MPIGVSLATDITIGDYYEDSAFHPCLCISVEDGAVNGISLVDGSYPRCCSVPGCGVRKLSLQEALHWKFYGPLDEHVADEYQWWKDFDRMARSCFPPIADSGG